jgi:dTDP-4-dehydrorhamnose reductase
LKVLILGCNGLLGQNLLNALPPEGGWQVVGSDLKPEPILPERLAAYHGLDISHRTDLEALVAVTAPDWIFNAAALTDVDLCEREPELNNRINRDMVGWLAATGIPLAHISTDYVFDGESGPYSEEDAVHPLSRYGSAKLESEALTFAGSHRSLVLRTITLWGKGNGMKTSFVEFVRKNLAAGKPVRIVTDQWGNPTLAEDLALAVWKLVSMGKSGLYHVAGSQWNSRFEWARAIAAFYGLDDGLIQPCLTADLKQAARRPLRSGLRIDKLKRETGFCPRDVEGQLRRMEDLAVSAV